MYTANILLFLIFRMILKLKDLKMSFYYPLRIMVKWNLKVYLSGKMLLNRVEGWQSDKT